MESAEIIRDRSTGQSRGFGFVVMKEHLKIKEAIAELNGKLMGGRPVTVNKALPDPSQTKITRGHHGGTQESESRRRAG